MRVSLQWLQELVPFRSAPDDLAERLSMAGFEVEEDEDLSARAQGGAEHTPRKKLKRWLPRVLQP